MSFEFAESALLALVVLLILGFLFWLSNLVFVVRKSEMRCEVDHRLNTAYQTWRERISSNGEVSPVSCPQEFDEGETCFAYEYLAFLYEPLKPHGSDKPEMPVFDSACGEPVDEGWSILDCFEGVNFIGKGFLFVTNRNLYLKGLREIKIPLGDLQVVATSCSNFLVEAKTMDRPVIFTRVNGQKLRDTVYMLLEKRVNVPRD